ncbi:enoyl-CoA hydratase/isomerase family protein [Kiloniella laminariae]|uniref:3-hydroxyisobutyryl-CoA hydrolase n=1 Tax=Kiloniella laminariae TaxID=454162 RepID=A0ABT4LMX3_9PROT|nr:enoyl-CoA hydratase/isomerase family protein [Kiloniella laminariae]MCZ4282500.1 enoyl-CoA hydratase/isomerase family protein [Kiloniella laminariae]
MTDELIVRQEGAAGRITLNRPKALNALTLDMVHGMLAALERWQTDETVRVVIVDGAGERGLCAGGDIRALYKSAQEKDGLAQKFWADEYRLNALIANYPKPYIAVMDGIVMGGGVGVSAHGSNRIVTERSMIAMPETAIGLFPDVGGSWLLANAPGEIGSYLGLTGHRIGAVDAIYAGLADVEVSSDRLPRLIETLIAADYGMDSRNDVDTLIRGFVSSNSQPPLAASRGLIDDVFSFDRIEDILAAAERLGTDWGDELVKTLRGRAPHSLKATLAALRKARNLGGIEDVLDMEYRLALRMFALPDFSEGVRAAVIDKTGDPKWSVAAVEDVQDEAVEVCFDSLGDKELGLSTRLVR